MITHISTCLLDTQHVSSDPRASLTLTHQFFDLQLFYKVFILIKAVNTLISLMSSVTRDIYSLVSVLGDGSSHVSLRFLPSSPVKGFSSLTLVEGSGQRTSHLVKDSETNWDLWIWDYTNKIWLIVWKYLLLWSWWTNWSHSLDLWSDVVYLHAVLLGHHHVVGGPGVSSQDHSVLRDKDRKHSAHLDGVHSSLPESVQRATVHVSEWDPHLVNNPSDGGPGFSGTGSFEAEFRQVGLQHCISGNDDEHQEHH